MPDMRAVDTDGRHDLPPFARLDFLYTPSRDVAGDMAFFEGVLGGRVVFAVEGMGTRVAAVELAEGPPLLLLTDHVEGDRTILVYRVDDLEGAMARQEEAGWTREATFEIPNGPICSFSTPGGHRIALYELTRPEAANHFNGRRDF
jgi:predicted enzyme related to lactoylglutathione lyase